MLAVNYTTLRDNMKTYMDKVTNDYETMIVTRKDNKNVKFRTKIESYTQRSSYNSGGSCQQAYGIGTVYLKMGMRHVYA